MSHSFSSTHFDQQQQLQSNHLTWLDLYPSTNGTSSRKLDSRLIARIDQVKETLAFVKWDIEIRRQLVAISDHDGQFCMTCSNLRVATSFIYCSMVCPLRRGCPETWMKRHPQWTQLAKVDVEVFDKLIIDMHHLGYQANKRIVIEWEITCDKLLRRSKKSEDRHNVRLTIHPVPGLNQDWTFDDGWGQGPDLEAEIAPDDMEPPATKETGASTPHEAHVALTQHGIGSVTTFDVRLGTPASWMGLASYRSR